MCISRQFTPIATTCHGNQFWMAGSIQNSHVCQLLDEGCTQLPMRPKTKVLKASLPMHYSVPLLPRDHQKMQRHSLQPAAGTLSISLLWGTWWAYPFAKAFFLLPRFAYLLSRCSCLLSRLLSFCQGVFTFCQGFTRFLSFCQGWFDFEPKTRAYQR